MSISSGIDQNNPDANYKGKLYPDLIPWEHPDNQQTLGEVLATGNSALNPTTGIPQSATDFDTLGCVNIETGKVYQGNNLALQIGEAGDNLQIKGATAKGSLLVGNGANTEELVVLPAGNNGQVLIIDDTQPLGVRWGGEAGDINSITAGNNINITGPTANPIVELQAPLTSTLNMGLVALTDSVASIGLAGQYLTAGSGGETLWATLPVDTLSAVLLAGNNAGATDIDLNNNKLLNCAEITSTGDLLLNPVGSIDANGKTLNMTNGEIHNCPLVHSQNNNAITIEGKGTGSVILKTSNTDRITVLDTGAINFQGGMSYDNTTDNLTATTFTGALSGNATTATDAINADNVATASTATNATHYVAFKTATDGDLPDKTDAGLTYNPSTNVLTTTTFSGALSGNATTATTADQANLATDADNVATASTASNSTHYVAFKTATSGYLPDKTDAGLTYNPSTNVLTTTTFSGALSGNATTATDATNANNVATASTSTNATHYVSFKTALSGNLPDKTDGGITYNPSTNYLTLTGGIIVPIRGADATISQGIATGGASTNCVMVLPTNYGGSTYMTNGSANIIPVQEGIYSLSVYGTSNQASQGNAFGLIFDGGFMLYNNGIQDIGTSTFIDGVWRYTLNIVRYFTAGDTFQIRANNWNSTTTTFSATVNFRLIIEN